MAMAMPNSGADIRCYNLTAPNLTTQYAFAQSAAAILRRPLIFAMPAAIMRMALGEQADFVPEGKFVTPSELQAENFIFQFPMRES